MNGLSTSKLKWGVTGSAIGLFLIIESGLIGIRTPAAEPDYLKTLKTIAGQIEDLKHEFPQLKDFSKEEHTNVERLTISYGYHTHKPRHRGGWTSGVPNPDDDGVWFYIDFHERDSNAQIHTQPVVRPAVFGGKNASFLILEGKNSRRLESRIWAILESNGVRLYGEIRPGSEVKSKPCPY